MITARPFDSNKNGNIDKTRRQASNDGIGDATRRPSETSVTVTQMESTYRAGVVTQSDDVNGQSFPV